MRMKHCKLLTTGLPKLKALAAACRQALTERARAPHPPKPAATSKPAASGKKKAAFRALYLSALALPGMTALADDGDDDVGLQVNHYEESKRTIYGLTTSGATNNHISTSNNQASQVSNGFTPITVEGQHAWGNFHYDDRTRLGFNFVQDLWSGATPQLIAPAVTGLQFTSTERYSSTHSGATPAYDQAGSGYFVNSHDQLFYEKQNQINQITGQTMTKLAPATQMTEVLSYASPEIRSQGDAHFGYDWDRASLDIGGGVSNEHDYLSSFGNVGGRFYFNQKQTTLNYGVSYTNSRTHALEFDRVSFADIPSNQVEKTQNSGTYINANREDWALNLGLSQVTGKNGLLSAGFSYTNSNGFLANPYKAVLDLVIGPETLAGYRAISPNSMILQEKRPNLRNQFTWNASYQHYIEPLDGAAKLNYNFFHDDWGINAHTFELEYRQNLGAGWMLTPRARYYSQTAATFFGPYFLDLNTSPYSNNAYSSDQRLAAYGTLSGGAVLSRDFAKGLRLELGYEYYSHRSDLTLGGGGSGDYMDFNYYVANATLRADLTKLAQVGGVVMDGMFDGEGMRPMDHAAHMARMQHGGAIPAAIMFGEMMPKGEYMLGYRFLQQNWGNGYQIGQQGGLNAACTHAASKNAYMMCNTGMTMNMQMLNFMYAPTDWLNLMLMPQYMTMNMNMYNTPAMIGGAMGQGSGMRDWESNGGFGDTGAYAMLKLWDGGDQKLFTSQGFTAPTGAIRAWDQLDVDMAHLLPYDMQNGSGTWDWNPSLTYTGKYDAVSWGAQLQGTLRMQKENYMHWRQGDIFQATAWGGYQWNDWLTNTLRVNYTKQGSISDYSKGGNFILMQGGGMMKPFVMPDIFAQNYGGTFVDAGFGLTLSVPKGTFAGNRVSAEWLQPMYTNFNGYQLERIGTLAITWGYMF